MLHDNTIPQVEHCINRSKVIMTPGMVFTIEPILVEGNRRIGVWEDGWTAATLDGGRCVQCIQLWWRWLSYIWCNNLYCSSLCVNTSIYVITLRCFIPWYRAAQFEHEVLITETGAEVITVPEWRALILSKPTISWFNTFLVQLEDESTRMSLSCFHLQFIQRLYLHSNITNYRPLKQNLNALKRNLHESKIESTL